MSKLTDDLKPFELSQEKVVFECSILRLKEQIAKTENAEHELKIYTFDCSDWVNVIPVTAKGEIVFVEQHRFGINKFTFEVPGGAVEKDEKDTTMAALRELEEETGLTSQRILALPRFSPNPAIQSNKVTYFIAFDVQPHTKESSHFDPFENIKLHFIPFKEALEMARTGKITHVLSAFAILLAEPYLNSKFS